MAASKEVFKIPIPAIASYQAGSIVCTTPAPQVYLLTWSGTPDNRLTPAFIEALLTALNVIEFGHPPGVLITTSAIPKFYSNGLDLKLSVDTPGFFENGLYALFRRFLTYPMPTVALINGHCFAGGLMLAMHHDYRVFTGKKGYLCLNELEFGAPLLPPMAAIFRIKCTPRVYRELALEAKRWDGRSALEAGIVDVMGEMDDVLKLVEERALAKKGTTGVYGLLKAEMYRDSVALLSAGGKETTSFGELQAEEKRRKTEGAKWFKEWERSQGSRAKL